MDDVNVQSILTEILDDDRKARRAKDRRGHKRLDLVEPHTLAKADHPHHLVISSMKSHRAPKVPATFPRKSASQVIMRFKARCKICGGEDAWATQEVEGLDL